MRSMKFFKGVVVMLLHMKDELIDQPDNKCHICKIGNVLTIKEFTPLAQVTSDCRPWKTGGKLGICRSCGFVQKIADDAFKRDCNEIYSTYAVYYQADGQEQKVFDQSKGLSKARSELILVHLINQGVMPTSGTLLDIGCGNGNLLRSFSKLCSSWVLSGLEFDEQNKVCIEKIENVSAFYSCELKDISGQFDMISMIHCLEHIIDPFHFLSLVKERLSPDGLLLIEIPTYSQNPFDLVIADHCTHFSVGTITNLLEQCGFKICLLSTDIVQKEITILARNDVASRIVVPSPSLRPPLEDSYHKVLSAIAWLKGNVADASLIAAHDDLGIFGTSIAGVWLYNEIPERISFFVDEDPDRINKLFLGLPVYHPESLPEKGTIFIPLPNKIAGRIAERLKMFGDRFRIPPAL